VPFPAWARQGIGASLGLPLLAQEKLIGFIWVGRRSADLRESEARLLAAIADIAANAIHRATLHEQTRQDAADLALAYASTLEGWARALELRHQETEGHTRRVAEMTLTLARAMNIPEKELTDIWRGALLHDIGKMAIPDTVLLKRGPLDDSEWEIMRQHPRYAFQMLAEIQYLQPALNIPLYHHEKWDGSGYPSGLAGKEIPLEARVFAVIDVWDALTSDRVYRPAWTRSAAAQYIREQSGRQFDPAVVDAFFRYHEAGELS
jgi:putative nucleotidyltransferase with HDIG domain